MKQTRAVAVVFAVLLCAVGLMAQVGGSGRTNSVARWTNSTTLGNSNIFLSNGSACAGGVGFGPCVGIGTTKPEAHLHLFMNLHGETTLLKVENAGAFSAATLELKAFTSDNLNDWRLVAQDTGAGNTEGLRVENANAGVAMEVAPNLNVGIGTRSPATKLQVAGGDMHTSDAGAGLIAKSPDGSICARIGIDNTGAITATPVGCP